MRLSVSLFLLLTQNLVWTRLLGLSGASALMRSNKAMLPSAVFVMILCPPACVFMTLFSRLVPDPVWTPAVSLLAVMLTAAAVDGLIRLTLKRHTARLEPYLMPGACSAAVFCAVQYTEAVYPSVRAAFSAGFSAGIEFFFAACMLQVLAPLNCSEQTPMPFRGWRGMYLCAGLLSMAALCIRTSVPA